MDSDTPPRDPVPISNIQIADKVIGKKIISAKMWPDVLELYFEGGYACRIEGGNYFEL